ncbi:MAG: hypothetical protein SA378_10915 [Sedimentibacter sp.]|uniref:hypothetical protein n=1 Tax=Sedimentibacter sp. TaxID=1960295 RepID=UPI00298191C6|nr:hypothetical protein [Sedimentibacter sp.]MDW5300629.1 hypothetical protein [Sedimentibacter sp.]
MIAHEILETKLINQYSKIYSIFAQNNALKLNLSEDNTINGLIQDVKSNNANSTYKKEIITPYNTLKTGDYITHTCNGKSINYIIESQIDTEIGCDKAYLLECPFSVKIFDWNFTDIREYPISLKTNNGSLGVTEGAIAITANSSFDIIIKYDEHTRSFVKSDNMINGIEHAKIMRVLIDGMAFSVVGVNHLISEGLLVISIENTNINSADNLDLGVADYTTYYREPIDYNKLINDEIIKYETTANVTKDILANTDITNTIKKLKTGQTANTGINVYVSAVDADNLLTLTDGVVTLTSQIPFEGLDNLTTVTLIFTAGGISKTLLVNITIEKQDEVITDEDIVNAEMLKYNSSAVIAKDVIANTDVTSTVFKMIDGQTANPECNVIVSSVDIDALLTLTGGVITLTDIIPFEATDNTTTVTLSFTKGTVTKTLLVNVTITKQDEVAPPNLVITGNYEDLCIGDTNEYTINTTNPVIWGVSNENNGLTLNTTGTSNICTVTAKSDTNLIGKQETLTATVNGFNYTYIIYIVSMI